MPVTSRAHHHHESRFTKCCHYIRSITAFIFSHIGLCALVFGYSMVGAFVFQALEAPNELKYRSIVVQERDDFADQVWTITQKSSVLKQKEWSDEVSRELEKLEKSLVRAFKYNGYDGKDDIINEKSLQWNFFGALLYSIIVITTIGFGNIAPKTKIGKIVTILYALVGIPLMLLFLSNIGDAMANSFKFLYWKVCCILCVNPRKHRHQHHRRRRRRHRKQRQHVERIALQSLSANVSEQVVTHQPTIPAYNTLPRANSLRHHTIDRPAHRSHSDRDIANVPIICNIYALHDTEFNDTGTTDLQTNGPFNPFMKLNYSTLPHNMGLSSPIGNNFVQLSHNSVGFERGGGLSPGISSTGAITTAVATTVDESDGEYYSDDSIESDSVIRSIPNVPIALCVALVVGYICGGGFLFQFLENWTFLDASYFSFITLTTIGFGDLVPGTAVFSREDAQTILGICALYLLFGMALIAMSFNLVKEEFTKKIRLIGTRIGILAKDDSDYDSD
ncbi:TWiK family of potassium channels protein 18-like [Oppia nitens]|uniref:TWiK family of potassium channels protein 18-like n=1 Tax=Oppia nitens TaxID=1686743 RepID=UPI0023DC1488|nr:TWiK family of potassium channels protein 18-like [Oppia nitens]